MKACSSFIIALKRGRLPYYPNSHVQKNFRFKVKCTFLPTKAGSFCLRSKHSGMSLSTVSNYDMIGCSVFSLQAQQTLHLTPSTPFVSSLLELTLPVCVIIDA